MKRRIKILISIVVIVIFFVTGFVLLPSASNASESEEVIQSLAIKPEPIITPEQDLVEMVAISVSKEDENILSDKDVELIALVTMAEAEGECEEGQRLVIDTILNRVDSEYFPDTVYDVIYQPNQFSSMWNGRVDRCNVRDDICKLVREEIQTRTNYEVMFFTAGTYGEYGKPMFQVQNHYFSSYE